ncbi:MAG: dihydrodipicolinate synthase family protein [Acidobacteriaceae bacterium]|nr:dihydrodipicolinate synthase family protein [Acidobacteriaceae bacterium]MBV9779218.1 dihydrodipicolinate synthase family protein [Acidobacteriaceae bacterium]
MGISKAPSPARGVYAALATPRRADSTEPDAAVLLDYLDAIAGTGVDGVVLFGATGEFAHFEIHERMRLLTFAVRRSPVPVLVNVSHSTLAGSLDLATYALETSAAGALLLPPYFDNYSDAQLRRFFEEFVNLLGGRIPIYLYNLPFLTNRISPELARRLLTSGAFAGIKDSSGEWGMFEALKRLQRERQFQLLIGNESLYVRARIAGADGIVSGVAAALPELIVAIDHAITNLHLDRARQLDFRLQEFVAWLPNFPTAVGIKQAAAVRGWKHDQFAVPLDPDTSAVLDKFRSWLSDWIPMVLSECKHDIKA